LPATTLYRIFGAVSVPETEALASTKTFSLNVAGRLKEISPDNFAAGFVAFAARTSPELLLIKVIKGRRATCLEKVWGAKTATNARRERVEKTKPLKLVISKKSSF